MTRDQSSYEVEDQIRMVFAHFPERFYNAQDFVDGGVARVDECHDVCEKLLGEHFVRKGTLKSDAPNPYTDDYYNRDDGIDKEGALEEFLSNREQETSDQLRHEDSLRSDKELIPVIGVGET